MTENVPNNLVAQSWTKPLTPPETIPASADVVIIGGGIIGVSTAWFLSRQGINVVLCEKGHIAGEQSGRNWGWIRQQCRDSREMPMIMESLKIWRTLEADIGEEVGFKETGCIYAAETDKQLAELAAWLPTAEANGLDTRLLSGQEVKEHIHGASVPWKGALYTPSDGCAEPHKAAPAISRAAERAGATILSSCAVRGLETEGGRASGVVTEHGTIKAPSVLCAGGAWTSMFCRSLGINLPQLKVRGTVVRTATCENVFDGDVWGNHTGMRRRQDGGYTLANEAFMDHFITPTTFRNTFKFLAALKAEYGSLSLSIGRDFIDELLTPAKWQLDVPSPFEKTRVLNPDPNPRAVAAIRKDFDELFPQLCGIDIVESWAGMIETTPDVIPVIDQSTKIPGFYMATGFSGHGFGIGPGAGKAIAGLITGSDSGIDLSEFRLNRFFDGSKIELYKKIQKSTQ